MAKLGDINMIIRFEKVSFWEAIKFRIAGVKIPVKKMEEIVEEENKKPKPPPDHFVQEGKQPNWGKK